MVRPYCVHGCMRENLGVCTKRPVWQRSGTPISPFPHRMPTFLRSMQFVLVPIAASWPLEGLIASSTSGMSWEVRGPPLQAGPVLSLQTPPQLVPWWAEVLVGRGLGLPYVSSVEHSWGQWPSSLGKSAGLTFLKKGRAFQLLGSSRAG